jgi:glucosamine--fructose-6-phosphate aminotransferase (isomerizing)
MCGIVGYVGQRQAAEILLEGLHRLEYRGYDSAGLAVAGETITVVRAEGKVANLARKAAVASLSSNAGIAHTRWATHGPPTEPNAHPHSGPKGKIVLVHNGIIENHATLKSMLKANGHEFTSDTDSEVVAHLVEASYDGDLTQAVVAALKHVEGTYGLVVMAVDQPDLLVVARQGSPIVIGVRDDETLIGSDVAALAAHTQNVIYLDDGDIATVTATDRDIRNIDNVVVTREVSTIDWDVEASEKSGFDHFMLKEIHEQPEALHNALRGRIDHREGSAFLSGLHMAPRDQMLIDRIIIAACGTSLHAGLVGEYCFEDLAGIPTEVEQAAEFRYRNPIVTANTLTLAVTQSGETADTLAALREAKMKGAQVAALCNVVGSTIAREAGRGVYLHAGPEIGVASTKAFTCQVAVMLMMALKFARTRRMSRQDGLEFGAELERIPELVAEVIAEADHIKALAEKYASSTSFFFMGRGCLFPVALEGALKLKEISYIHAEGYHASELKHGPIALLTEDMPVMALANDDTSFDKMAANIQECLARSAPVIATATRGNDQIAQLTDDVIWLPKTSPWVASIPAAVAMQLFSYYAAAARGCEIDQPRNLAKAVTVE